jgi:PAS domain S-box-containing protein
MYVGLLLPASAISATLLVYAWRHRERRGAVPLAVTLAGALCWELSALLSVVGRGTPLALFSTQPATVGANLAVVGFVLFALAYTGREDRVTLRTGVALSVVPAVALVLKTVNSLHGTYWTSVVRDMSEISGYTIEYGLAFYGYTAYSYALLFVGTLLILDYAADAASVYRYQTTAIVVAVLVPLVSNALLVFEVVETDLAPVAFAVSGVAFWWAIYRAEFLDLAPIGRQVVVDDLYDGVFTVDRDHRLVDVNPTGRKLFGFEDEDIVGKHVDDLLADFPEIRTLYWRHADRDGDTEFDIEFAGRYYHVEILSLTDGLDAGRTIHVRDVTDQKRREQELERKNERLERFASIVSHDLRNPLNVIQGRVELAEDDDDVAPHLDSIATNADRMGDIIEDVLAMTRNDGIGRRERVDVATLAQRAWEHVHTDDATLETPGSRAVTGDPDRLVQLFENLFRNAVHHGGPGVTVTVGPLDDGSGFFVADDGPGIPPEDRERILEDGYTTSEAGTGLGLSIVAEIVDAHGWTLDVTDSDAGGARFEVHCGATDTVGAADAATEPVSDGGEWTRE